MPNLNRVLLMGNLTRDPELRYLPSNMPVVNFSVAVNRRWRNQQSGETQEEVTFIDCEAFSKTAETINQYLKKGRPIFVEGRLRLDQWQDKEGHQRSRMKVVVENFQFVDSKPGGGGGDAAYNANDAGTAPAYGAPTRPAPQHRTPAGNAPAAPPGPPAAEPHQPVGEEDIPF